MGNEQSVIKNLDKRTARREHAKHFKYAIQRQAPRFLSPSRALVRNARWGVAAPSAPSSLFLRFQTRPPRADFCFIWWRHHDTAGEGLRRSGPRLRPHVAKPTGDREIVQGGVRGTAWGGGGGQLPHCNSGGVAQPISVPWIAS
eukprot:1034253-Rhodomonas_salina.3